MESRSTPADYPMIRFAAVAFVWGRGGDTNASRSVRGDEMPARCAGAPAVPAPWRTGGQPAAVEKVAGVGDLPAARAADRHEDMDGAQGAGERTDLLYVVDHAGESPLQFKRPGRNVARQRPKTCPRRRLKPQGARTTIATPQGAPRLAASGRRRGQSRMSSGTHAFSRNHDAAGRGAASRPSGMRMCAPRTPDAP